MVYLLLREWSFYFNVKLRLLDLLQEERRRGAAQLVSHRLQLNQISFQIVNVRMERSLAMLN